MTKAKPNLNAVAQMGLLANRSLDIFSLPTLLPPTLSDLSLSQIPLLISFYLIAASLAYQVSDASPSFFLLLEKRNHREKKSLRHADTFESTLKVEIGFFF